jgi:HK97 family phage major capsid protein
MKRKIQVFMLPLLRGRSLVLSFLYAVMAIFAIALFLYSPPAGIMGLCLPFMFGIVLPEEEFQKKVLTGVEALDQRLNDQKAELGKQVEKFDSLDRDTKKAFEDLTLAKKSCNDLNDIVKGMQRVQLQLGRESRMAFGDPIARFCADEEKRNWLNGIVRAIRFPGMKLPDHLSKALTGVDASMGGALIPTEYMPEIYNVLASYGAYNTLGVRRVGARTNSLPLMSVRPAGYWLGAGAAATEGTAIGAADYTGSSVTLSIQSAVALAYASAEELEDATVDMAPQILRDLAESIAYVIDYSAFTSDGTADATDAGYYGIFQLAAAVHTGTDYAAAGGNLTVATTDLDDWIGCQQGVSAAVNRRPTTKWWMHPTILAKVALIKDLNGRSIFQTALEAPSTTIGSILGKPVVPVDAAPSTDAANAKIAVYGDAEAQVVAIRSDIKLATSADIKFAENMIGYRAIMRAGIKTRVPTGNPAGFIPFQILTLPNA